MNGQLGDKQEGKAGHIQMGQSSLGTDPKPRDDCGPRRGCLTLDPSGHPYHKWLVTMVTPILYNWIILICRSCFPELQRKHLGLWLGLDSLSDLLYLLDMLVHLCTGYLEEGVLIRDPSRVAQRYLYSASFRWDVASVLPTELLYLLPGGMVVPGVRVNRLLRTPRLLEALDRIETRTAHPHAFRLSKLMVYVFVTLHWNACLYFAISSLVGFGADAWVLPNVSMPGFDRLLHQYLHSVYFSTLVLTTVGDTPMPQRWEEFLFMAANLLLAVLAFATIVGSVASVVSGRSKARATIYPDQDLVKGYLRTHCINPCLQRRVAAWYQHLRMNQKATGEGRILQPLSGRLRAQVAISVHLPALRQVRLFQHCEQSLLEALVLKLRPQVYSPGEFVCRKGEVGHEMYFIREGRLAVVADDGLTQYAVLGEGVYFGEISIIHIAGNMSGNRRTASIQSLGFSDLFSLSKEDLAEVLSEFPQAKALLEAKGREILLRMGKLDLNAEAVEVARQQQEERRAAALGEGLEVLQTKLARVLAGLESSAFKMAVRLERLEWQWQAWGEGAAET